MTKDLQDAFDEFLYDIKFIRQNSDVTIEAYHMLFDLFKKTTGVITTVELTGEIFRHFFIHLQKRQRIVGRGIIKKGVKSSTIATYWGKLNTFLKWAKVKKYIDENPLLEMPVKRPKYEDRKFLSKHDVEKILSAIHLSKHNDLLLFKRNMLLFHILLFCGLRKGEILALQIRDIDLSTGLMAIRAETSKSKRMRIIPLHRVTLMHLKDYLTERKHYTTQYLFVSKRKDDRLTADGFKHLVHHIQLTSGVRFHPHQLRHTFAINFLKTTNNISKLQQLLGHRSIIMTTVYLRCLPPTEMKKDINAMSVDSFI